MTTSEPPLFLIPQDAENERQLAEKRLHLSLAIMPITVFQQDLNLRYTYITNPRIDLPAEEIVGHLDTDIFAPEVAAALTAIKRRVLTSGTGEHHEIPIRYGERRFWFDLLVEAERGPDGKTTGVIGAGADITEHKLREERYRTVLEDQTELISRYRPDGVIVYANEVYCRFFGRTEKELIGRCWHPVAHPDDVALIEAQLLALSPEHPVVLIENRVVASDGSTHWMQFVNRAFFDTEGRLVDTQSVGRDITDRKILEAELSEYRARLQALLENTEQTRENQRKEIAREIHDQLGAIHLSIGYRLESLMHNFKDKPALHSELLPIKSLVAQAHAATKAICSQLRPPSLDDLGLVPTCRWYLKDWSARTGIKARSRLSRLPEDLPEQLSTDLFRVFQELLSNVAKHSGASSVDVSLSGGRQGVRLRVADNGGGMRPAATPSGYGLLGVKERIAWHGGGVSIKSGAAGTVLTISAPLGGRR